jgi:predicted DsbA family dithiol-disulfide isomerase
VVLAVDVRESPREYFCEGIIVRDPAIHLEIFFDLGCPFTLLAKVKIDNLLRTSAAPVQIAWSPRLLHTSLPPEGIELQSALLARYGEKARPMQLHVERMAADLGITLDHSRVLKVPNTLEAHCAVRFAAKAGRAAEMIDAVMRAYWLEYRDITSRKTLAELLDSLGLDGNAFCSKMEAGELRAEVLAAHEDALSRGGRSVPSYRLNGTHIENTSDLIPELQRLVVPA